MRRLSLTKTAKRLKYKSTLAEVAELADALRSGRSECTLMRVRVPPSAPQKKSLEISDFFYLILQNFECPKDNSL